MKNKLYITLFAASALALSSCETKVNNFMVDDTVSLVNPGLVEEYVYTGLDDPSTVYVLKSGKGFQGAKVRIAVDETVLTDYNTTAKIEMSSLPEDCYSIAVSSLELGRDDYMLPFLISWNRDRLAEVLALDPNVVIPLRLYVENDDVNVNLSRMTTLINPILDNPYVSLDSYGLFKGLTPTHSTSIEEDVYISVSSNFIPSDDIDYTITVDPSLIDSYNEEHGTQYQLLPADAYRMDSDWTLKKSMTDSRFKFTFVRTALIPEEGSSKFGDYILPLKINTKSSSIVNPEKSYLLYTVSVVASKIDKSKWTIVECNSCISDDPDPTVASDAFPAENLIDDNSGTFWKTVWSVSPELPVYVVIDFGQERDLYRAGFEIPSSTNRKLANNKAGYVEASSDGKTWEKIADWESPTKTSAAVEFAVKPTTARYMKFVISETFATPNTTALAEINVWGE